MMMRSIKKGGDPPSPPAESPWLWVAVFTGRVLMSLLLMQTFDAPDEWWQSLEVAYWFVFDGKGHLTWEWLVGVRSFIYPAPFAAVYYALRVTRMDYAALVYAAPKVMSGLVCGCVDWATYHAAAGLSSSSRTAARTALMLSLTSWYTAFVGLRTLSNALEMLLMPLALIAPTFDGFLIVVGLGCAIRPTFALPVAALLATRIYNEPTPLPGDLLRKILRVLWKSFAWLACTASVDRVFYGTWLLTPVNFARFNVTQGLSAMFGVHPWHWYIDVVPVILGPSVMLLPTLPRLIGGRKGDRSLSQVRFVFFLVLFTLSCYSVLPHKELRFAAPLVPLIHLLLAAGWVSSPWAWARRLPIAWAIAVVGLGLTVFTLGLWQRGTVAAMNYLRSATDAHGDVVHVLTCCHSTPGYSYVHGVVDELVMNECPLLIDEKTGWRVPTEHHYFVKHPDLFTWWIYDGTQPPEGVRDAADAALGTYRFNEPEDMMLVPEELSATLYTRIKPRARKLPHRFLIFDADEQLLLPFFQRHGFELEVSLLHCPPLPFLSNASYVQLWRAVR